MEALGHAHLRTETASFVPSVLGWLDGKKKKEEGRKEGVSVLVVLATLSRLLLLHLVLLLLLTIIRIPHEAFYYPNSYLCLCNFG
uniref:Uncharacterized protein n=1 Tax=Caenorhabditis japonica TaxID=281687 RepID=A0A8R1EVV6_CAEJA